MIRTSARSVCLVLCVSAGFAAPAWAETPNETTIQAAITKASLANQQRMLSQRMSKAACMIGRQIEGPSHYDQLLMSHRQYTASDEGLRYGDERLGIGKETERSVLNVFEKSDSPWKRFDYHAKTLISTKKIDPVALQSMNTDGLEVMDLMDSANKQISRVYGISKLDIPLALTITVGVAGRQLMLSQKMVKEACMLGLHNDPQPDEGAQVMKTVELFDRSLDALIDGFPDAGVVQAPTSVIESKLRNVRHMWEEIRPLFAPSAQGEAPDRAAMARIARLSEPMMQTMTEAAILYNDIRSLPGY